MNEERHERRIATRLASSDEALGYVKELLKWDFRDARDTQVVIEQGSDGWSAIVSGTFEVTIV